MNSAPLSIPEKKKDFKKSRIEYKATPPECQFVNTAKIIYVCILMLIYIYIYIEVNIYPSNFSFFLSIVVVTLNSKSRRMVTFSIRFCSYGSDTYPMEHKGIITLSKRENEGIASKIDLQYWFYFLVIIMISEVLQFNQISFKMH